MTAVAIVFAFCAACAGHVTSPTSPMSSMPPPETAYGWQNGVADLGFIAAGNVMFYTADRVHASDETVRHAASAWAFAWAVTDAGIHYAHRNAAGAVAGPALKFGASYLIIRSSFADRHRTLAAIAVLALALFDDVALAR
jgi:hypothetical protein